MAANTRKRNITIDDNTDVRLFAHIHFDETPALSFLVADVLLAENAINLASARTGYLGSALPSAREQSGIP